MLNIYVYQINGKITAVNAGDYEITSDGWHLVYSGEDEAAPDLFPKGLTTEKGGFIYALDNGEVVERSADAIAADEQAANPEPIATTDDVLNALLGVSE